MSSRLTKKSLLSVSGRCGEDAVRDCRRSWRPARAGRRPAPSSPARSASAAAPCRPAARPADPSSPLRVVAEAVGGRLQHGERVDVGLLLRRVRAARREGHRHVVAGGFSPPSRPRAAAQHDQVGQRDLSCRRTARVEVLLDAFQRCQHLGQLGRLVDLPVLLRRQADARAVGAAALVAAAEGGGRRPGGRDQLRSTDRPEARIFAFSAAMSCASISGWSTRGPGPARSALPSAPAAEVARARAHVAVRQLEPGAGEGVGELPGSRGSARDLLVGRVEAQRQVGRGHHRRVRFFDGSCASGTGCRPARPFRLPLVAPAGLLVSSHS
jgi:hypothetical protein